MKMSNVAISIIIPVYNLSNYITECLGSILKQRINFKIEVIVINDGSTDDSLEKIEKCKQENTDSNKNIIILNQENLGVSEARNNGIRASKGDFLLFIDGDDYINDNMLADMFELSNREGADIVVSDFNMFTDNDNLNFQDNMKTKYRVYHSNDAVQAFIRNDLKGYIWGILYSRYLFTDIFFERGVYCCEDMLPALKLYYKSNKTIKLETKYYNYRQGRIGSATSTGNQKKFMDSTVQLNNCYEFICSIPETWVKEFSLYYKVNKLIYKWPFYCSLLNYSRKEIYNYESKFLGELPNKISTLQVLKSNIIPSTLKIRYLLYKIKVYDLYFRFKEYYLTKKH